MNHTLGSWRKELTQEKPLTDKKKSRKDLLGAGWSLREEKE